MKESSCMQLMTWTMTDSWKWQRRLAQRLRCHFQLPIIVRIVNCIGLTQTSLVLWPCQQARICRRNFDDVCHIFTHRPIGIFYQEVALLFRYFRLSVSVALVWKRFLWVCEKWCKSFLLPCTGTAIMLALESFLRLVNKVEYIIQLLMRCN